jgi:hypothetical protein
VKLFQSIHWKIDLDLLAKDDIQEAVRVILGVIALKYKVYLHLMDEVVEGVIMLIKE